MREELASFLVDLTERRGASEHTTANYGLDLTGMVEWLEGRGLERWTNVDRRTVRAWTVWLGGQGYARASIARKLSAARTFYRYLMREGRADTSPFALVPAPKGSRRLPTVLSVDEIERLVAAPDATTALGLRDRAMLEVMYATGLRVSELLGLTLQGILPSERCARVVGKGSKERLVLMGDLALDALDAYLDRSRPVLCRPQSGDALFLSHIGRPLSVRGFHLILENHLKTAGISRAVTPHTVRHSFATHMLEGGADLRSVQELLGHANVSTTQVYMHVSEGYLRDLYSQARGSGR